jgi:2,3-bisphosphoglycerate-independent phosphoglycerate mutase
MKLELSKRFAACPGPVVTIVLDGVGISPREEGDAIKTARTPMLDSLFQQYPWIQLRAHGVAVGMPSDEDMGNSEVGHNAMGAGRVFAQGAKLVSQSIASGAIWQGQAWKDVAAAGQQKTLHFIGLFSDGNVHSHMDHLKAMIERAKKDSVKTVRVHILLDGRDVGETSALEYVEPFESFLAGLNGNGFDAAIASGGGRMFITMDRYEADWQMVARGWAIHVKGEGRKFACARDAIETYRSENPKVIDQDLPGFVIERNGMPVGRIENGDAVVYFNFRGDRAIEISRAFTEDSLDKFDRGPLPTVTYAGMMQYDGDLKLPKRFLVVPPAIDRTLGEYMASSGVTQFAISETQKYGHVTYFWNGNRSGKFDAKTETYVEITSDVIPFEQRPWMKCAEITDALIDAIKSKKYRYMRANYANGDMVGHTGNFEAAVTAMQALDLQLARLIPVILAENGTVMVTADHGNADEMYELDKKGNVKRDKSGHTKAKTSHTLNPVPFVLITGSPNPAWELRKGDPKAGLSNIAATVLNLLGFEAPPDYDPSLIKPVSQ